MSPALGPLRRLDCLDEGEGGAKLSEGAHPVGAIEDEVTVHVRGYYHGVALLTFCFHALPQAGQAVFVVGLVQDQALKIHK